MGVGRGQVLAWEAPADCGAGSQPSSAAQSQADAFGCLRSHGIVTPIASRHRVHGPFAGAVVTSCWRRFVSGEYFTW